MSMGAERQQQFPKLSEPEEIRSILDLEGYVVVEQPLGGRVAVFKFPDAGLVSFIRTKDLDPDLFEAVLAVVTRRPTRWPFLREHVGSRVFGEAPDRTISDWLGPTHVFRPGLRDWALLVIDGRSELFARLDALTLDLRQKVRPS